MNEYGDDWLPRKLPQHPKPTARPIEEVALPGDKLGARRKPSYTAMDHAVALTKNDQGIQS